MAPTTSVLVSIIGLEEDATESSFVLVLTWMTIYLRSVSRM